MPDAFIYDHVRTPRGRGKADGALHEVTALNLATQALGVAVGVAVIGQPLTAHAALSSYRHVLASRLPVYTVADMRDPGGRIVHYERLLLPFGQNGIEVDRLLASLETVSPEGAFENRGLMNAPPRPPAFALCTTIQV